MLARFPARLLPGLLLGSMAVVVLLAVAMTMQEAPGRPAVLQAATIVTTPSRATPTHPIATPYIIPTPYPYATWLAPAKRELLERVDHERATVIAISALTASPLPWGAPHSPGPRLVTPAPFVTPPPGGPFHVAGDGMLVDEGHSIVPSAEFITQNGWFVAVPGGILDVYVGAEGYDAGPDEGWGALQLAMTSEQTRIPQFLGEYRTPTRVGPVHVVGAIGMRLQIATLDGSSTFTFDVSARQWVTP